MARHSSLRAMSVVATLGLVGAASAGDVFYMQIDNPTQNIPDVDDYQTTGADMAGMLVTVFFSAAPPETDVWDVTDAVSGEAVGADGDWVLSQSMDTFLNPWTLTYDAFTGKGLLTGFRIDGFWAGPGEVGVMFDRTFGGGFGTPNSFRGRDFELVNAPGVPFDVIATYQGAVGVNAPPVGDEFRWLQADFVVMPPDPTEFDPTPPRISGLDGTQVRTVQFYADTNNPIIPEPASLLLLAVSGLVALRRR